MKKVILSVLGLIVLLVGAYLVTLFFFPQTFLAGYQHTQHYLAGYEQQTTEVDGYTWHYLDTNPGANAKPLILMVHGFGGDKDNWTLLAQALRERMPAYRLIAVDLPGFGDNTRDAALAFDIPSQTQRLKAFVNHLGLPAMHVVGNSMGGHIAAYYTAQYPADIKTVSLLANAGVRMPVKSELQLSLEQGKNPLLVQDKADFSRLMQYVFVTPPEIPEPIQAYFAEKAVESREYNMNVFNQLIAGDGQLEPVLPAIQQPVLIIWGDTDRVLDKSMIDVMTPLLQNEVVLVLENTGHIPQAERPETVAKAIQQFIQAATQSNTAAEN